MRELNWTITPGAVHRLNAGPKPFPIEGTYSITRLTVESANRVAQALAIRYGIRMILKVAK